MPDNPQKILRLLLGDQLNSRHSWFATVRPDVVYVLMEIRQETDYALHHIQKVTAFFAAMRHFAQELKSAGHQVHYITLSDAENRHNFKENITELLKIYNATTLEYQLPDEYRLDAYFNTELRSIPAEIKVCDTEHFYTTRTELGDFFRGKKQFLMESFYRHIRTKHNLLMEGGKPLTGVWNYDKENRKKLPKNHVPPAPLIFENRVETIVNEIEQAGVKTMGNINPEQFVWPVNREQSLQLLDYFVRHCLEHFGTFQDAMTPGGWSLYHSRLSFSMNVKMLSPQEVIETAIQEWKKRPETISYNQLEGFVRQIAGWREYMRGIYWHHMPGYAELNYFGHENKLPAWYWNGKTKMHCLRDSITQSLDYAYAHHIQRLMITGNFALLAGVHPDETDAWYLGIYIDALDWVEITNTRGMSQFADGGIVGTKPYVSSAAYVDKMSHYCGSCYYDKSKKTGERACPFNSLYWNFYHRHEDKLGNNPRIGMMYSVWHKMKPEEKNALLNQAEKYLKNVDEL
ncbi:MAG: cryptochrome/photolyase family protein [Flavobacteriales bacterium]|nr:cryptochrome/photolyase family protein [Flavobacteriales bacterium]